MAISDPATLTSALSATATIAAAPLGTTATWLFLGLGLGVVHAFDADHVMALSVFAAKRRSARAGAMAGLRWALGHGLVLLVAGLALVFAGEALPTIWVVWAERCVAMMMIGLGVAVFLELWRQRTHLHFHAHDDLPPHAHWHSHRQDTDHHQEHGHSHTSATGDAGASNLKSRVDHAPLLVGGLHGFAGSAPILAVIPMAARSPILGLTYLVVFGVGVALSMAIVSGLLGHFAGRLAAGDEQESQGARSHSMLGRFRAVSGMLSIFVGIWMLGAF